MAGTLLPNLGLFFDWALGTTYKDEMDLNLGKLDAIVQLSVISSSLGTPPGSPTFGDRYIVGPSATGDWVGMENEVTYWDGAAWVMYTPVSGWRAWVEDVERLVTWNGTAWIEGANKGVATPASAAGVLDLDFATASHFQVTLTENVTSITFSNFPPATQYQRITVEFTQDATGSWTVAGWPAAVKWPGGTAPVITAAIGSVDVLEGVSMDAGANVRMSRTQANSS